MSAFFLHFNVFSFFFVRSFADMSKPLSPGASAQTKESCFIPDVNYH